MPRQRQEIRMERRLRRQEDRPPLQRRQVAGQGGRQAELGRGQQRVGRAHAEQPLVKGPVAEPAERQAVARVVVVGDRQLVPIPPCATIRVPNHSRTPEIDHEQTA